MQGHKILLENRQQDQQKTISRNNDKYGYEFASEITHNYEFSFKRKSSSGPTECKQTELNIKQLELPNSLTQNHQPNKSFKCLKKRRNRLGFTIKPIVHNCTQGKQQRQKQQHNERNDDDYIDAMECQNNEEIQDDHSHYRNDDDDDDDDDDIDFDFDVQRLIWLREESMVNDNNNATTDGNNGGNKKNKHHHHNKNKKNKNKKNKTMENNNNKKKKKITFSLSRPQSPRTVQVIRVDVTTNCYPSEVDDSISSSTSATTTMNNNNNSDNDYYCQRYRRRYGFSGDGNTKQTNSLPATANNHGKKTVVDGRTMMMMMEGPRSANCDKSNDRDDFTILCRKLTLSPKGRRKFV